MPDTSSKSQKAQQDFKNFYDAKLREEYAKLELSRKKYLRMFWKNLTILILLIIYTFFMHRQHLLMLALFEMKWPIYLWFSLMAFMVPLCIAPFILYERETKSATMEKILSFWGNFKCSNIHTISEENIKKSKIFNFLDYYNHITIGDAFEGEYNKTKIYMDEKQIRTSKNGFYLFDGLLIMFQFDKNFSSNVVVKNHKNIVPTIKLYLVVLYFFAIFAFFVSACLFILYQMVLPYNCVAALVLWSFYFFIIFTLINNLLQVSRKICNP